MTDTITEGHNPLGIRMGNDSDVTIQESPRKITAQIASSVEDLSLKGPEKAQQGYCDMSGWSCDSQNVEDQLKDLAIADGTDSPQMESSVKTADLLNLGLDEAETGDVQPLKPLSNQNQNQNQNQELESMEALSSKLEKVGTNSMNLNFDLDLNIDELKMSSSASTPNFSENYALVEEPARQLSPDSPLRLRSRVEGPNSLLIERFRSVRRPTRHETTTVTTTTETEKEKEENSLPENVLKMVSFSPNSPWIGSDLTSDEEENYSPDISTTEPVALHKLPVYSNKPEPVPAKQVSFEQSQSVASENQPADNIHRPIELSDPVMENDRGRLFLQINKVSNLRGLPIDATRKPKFALNLNNGQQSVRTDKSNLPNPGFSANQNSAKVGQEFELIVGKDLNLEITMHVSMNTVQKPAKFNYVPKAQSPPQSIKSDVEPKEENGKPVGKVKGFFMRSPKKKQHKKFNSQMSIQSQDTANQQLSREKAKYDEEVKQFYKRADIWKNITGSEGEYCRGYLVASHYEQDIYGAAKSFNLSLYNEWDKTTKGVPRAVCDLNITMMYVPKLFASENIPESLSACQSALESARRVQGSICQGYLTQQGGDCVNIWKRRWFALNGSEMVGFTDSNGKKRAVIHLENVTEVKDHLTDDLWCIYKDRCFQAGFTDGEIIGFYADTVAERNAWVQALQNNVANASKERRAWTDLVLEKEMNAY